MPRLTWPLLRWPLLTWPLLTWPRRAAQRAVVVATAMVLVGVFGATAPLTASAYPPGAYPPGANPAGGSRPGAVTPLGSARLADRGEEVRQDVSRLLRGLATAAAMGPLRSAAPGSQSGRWQWPIAGPERVAERFDGPAQPWLRGHRGVDLLGYDGVPVTAVDDGVVSYSGTINGVGIISVQHPDGLRSTYQPVSGDVPRGRSVRAGQRIGYLQTLGSHCWPRACLHLGARRGQVYLDPLLLLGAWEVSLLPIAGG